MVMWAVLKTWYDGSQYYVGKGIWHRLHYFTCMWLEIMLLKATAATGGSNPCAAIASRPKDHAWGNSLSFGAAGGCKDNPSALSKSKPVSWASMDGQPSLIGNLGRNALATHCWHLDFWLVVGVMQQTRDAVRALHAQHLIDAYFGFTSNNVHLNWNAWRSAQPIDVWSGDLAIAQGDSRQRSTLILRLTPSCIASSIP